MEQKRVKFVDLAGGILILWIMAFHAMNNCKVFGEVDVRVALPFLTFSMPWFFYRSGQFFKEMPCRKGVVKDCKKLLIPFLKWSLIGYVVYLAILAIDRNLTWHSSVVDVLKTFSIYGYILVNVPSWFVLSLLFVRIISRFLIRWSIPPVATIIICIAIGFGLHRLNNPLPFYIPNVAMGIAFFMIGYRLGRYETNKQLFAVCLVGYLAFLLWGPSIVGHHRNILLSGDYLLWPLFAYCGIVAFNNLCRYLDAFLSRSALGKYRPITFIGQYTLILLVAHALVYYPVMHFSTLPPWPTVGIMFLGYAVLLTPLLLRARTKQQKR